MNTPAASSYSQTNLLWVTPLLIGIVAGIACIIAAPFAPEQFFRAYLFSYLFFVGMPLGSLALVMLHHQTGGAWGVLVRRLAEAQMRTLPLMALLFLPIALGLPYLYDWAGPTLPYDPAEWSWKPILLQPVSFCIRAAIYFAAWLLLAFWFSRWSGRQDDSDDPVLIWWCNRISGPGLVLFGVMFHFATIDWVMSLQTKFTSTIIGLVVFSGQLLAAYSLSLVLFCRIARHPAYRGLISESALNDLGSLLFTFLMVWAYLVWFQFMLIWIADLEHGTVWYLTRFRRGWNSLATALIVTHFIVPFFLLLFRRIKRDVRWLGATAVLVAVSQLFFTYLQVMPTYGGWSIGSHWMDFLLPIAIGGVWFGAWFWRILQRPLIPTFDLNIEQAIHLQKLDEEHRARAKEVSHA